VRPNKTFLLAAFAALVCSSSRLQAASPLKLEDIRKTEFYGSCRQKQWSVTPDGTFSLVLAAGNDDCYGSLYFYSPLPVGERSALQFSFRSYKGRVGFAVRAASREEAKAVVQSDAFIADTGWSTDSLALGSNSKDPSRIARLDVVVFPRRHAADEPHSLIIRNFQIKRLPAVPAISAAPAHAVLIPAAAARVAPRLSVILKTKPIPPLRSFWHRWRTPLLIVFAIPFLLAFGKHHPKIFLDQFSPLYEINTRTWKSERDGDGVVRIGGFNKITAEDLKGFKAAGFNAVWLMGLWQIGAKVRAVSKTYGADFQGSPFAISDYAISEDLGSEEEFKQFVERAHQAGLRVLADFVPNHMGFDSPWLSLHPEHFIHKVLSSEEEKLTDGELQLRYPGYFPYRTPSYPENGRRGPRALMVAYGRDPYFYPWIDTAQLDYAQPGLRRQMIEILSYWSKIVDGVRCDMAMLVLRDQVKAHRHPEMKQDLFDQLMPQEFWSEAIRTVKRLNPNFVFIAETYWAMEGYLQHLGFDYTYNKPVYEAVCHAFHTGHAESLLNFLRMLGEGFLKRSAHFLENHDEERAMNALGEERQKGAAVLLATLPGLALLHQGQLDGKRERLPVQRVVPLQEELNNVGLSDYYRRLLTMVSTPLFREGRLRILYANNPAFVSYARLLDDSRALVIVNCSNQLQKGVVHLAPGMELQNGGPFRLNDLFYPLKSPQARRRPGVQPHYLVPAAQLINSGLYVELQPFDAHIFLFERDAPNTAKEQVRRLLRSLNTELPFPRAARRLLGPAFMRRSDIDVR
jgi:glycosidase